MIEDEVVREVRGAGSLRRVTWLQHSRDGRGPSGPRFGRRLAGRQPRQSAPSTNPAAESGAATDRGRHSGFPSVPRPLMPPALRNLSGEGILLFVLQLVVNTLDELLVLFGHLKTLAILEGRSVNDVFNLSMLFLDYPDD